MNKSLIFALLMICQLICAFSLSIIEPFFPPFAQSKGISTTVIGIILSANPVGGVIGSSILGKVLKDSNRIKFMLSSLILQSIGLYLFLTNYFIQSPLLMISISMIARMIGGFASSFFLTPLYAYIPNLYPESVEKMIGVAELFISFGFLIGPIIGSLLYSVGGYTTPFIVIGSIAILIVPFVAYQFNRQNNKTQLSLQINESTLNSSDDITINNIQETKSIDKDDIPLNYSEILIIYPIIILTLCIIVISIVFNFYTAIIAIYLENQFDLEPDKIGFAMGSAPLGYFLSVIIIANINKNRKLVIQSLNFIFQKIIFIACISIGIICIFIGPDQALTGISPHLYLTIISLGLLGFLSTPLQKKQINILFLILRIIYNIPLLNDVLLSRFPTQPNQCMNMASALFNIGFSLGELIGPIAAGTLNEIYGFQRSMSLVGFVIILYSIFYFPILFSKKSKQEKKMQINNETI